MDELKNKTVLSQLVQLQRMDTAKVKDMWRRICGTEPPAYSRNFLLKRLACKIQEQAFGGLSARSEAQLTAILQSAGFNPQTGEKRKIGKARGNRSQPPPPGTLLERFWNGQVYRVQMLVDGACELEGQRFRSLSGAAKAICGTTVNGFVFFGLISQNAKRNQETTETTHG